MANSNSTKKLRIGNAGGFWGDDPEALLRQVSHGQVDYVTMDFLAEITMSILQKQKKRDPSRGYAHDLITMLRDVLPLMKKNNTKLITNAGGVNPEGCALAIQELAAELNIELKIAVVKGDDILSDLDKLQNNGCPFENMESGETFAGVRDQIEAANVYFGCMPVVSALKSDPDIVITGRVTDTGITIAPMIHHFGWSFSDWDKMASGVVAGHILECGSQATGGNLTDWKRVKDYLDIGFPIVEVEASGDFVVSKTPNSGGQVSTASVKEQLFYEMGNPKGYITPDVVADFSSIQLEDLGDDRVKIFGVKGMPSTGFYKVSMAYTEGYKVIGDIAISGPNARGKAEKFSEIFWHKLRDVKFSETSTEIYGWNVCHKSLTAATDANEVILRLGARHPDKAVLQKFAKFIPALILAGPAGVCVLGGLPRVHEVVSYWPALLKKDKVEPEVGFFSPGESTAVFKTVEGATSEDFLPSEPEGTEHADKPDSPISDVVAKNLTGQDAGEALERICYARSGDKGDAANIGLIARSPEAYEFICRYVTAGLVKNVFQEFCQGEVRRYKLDNLTGLNFILEQSLGGGGTKTLRTDAQGKTFAQALLRIRMSIPEAVIASCDGGATPTTV